MKKDKIYELRIDEDDEISGIDSISLVSEPAIEINWVAFNKVKQQDFLIPDGDDEKYLMMLEEFGQSEQELLDEGYTIHSVGNFNVEKFFETYPNAESDWNTDEYLVRYKYVLNPEASGQRPIELTTRQFCRTLINRNMVFRIEDMDRLVNDQGDSALVWRGGYNCRHSWSKILYRKDATIVNKASVNKGKIYGEGGVFPTDMTPTLDVLGYGQPDTRTSHPSFSKDKMEIVEPNINVYGYHTRFFQICPGAVETFKHLISMEVDEDTVGMIRSAAQVADNVFRIEDEVIKSKNATLHQYQEASVLVEDFKDIIHEIDELTDMVHDVSYMDGHIEVIKKYLDNQDLGYDNILPPFVDEGIRRKKKKMSKQNFQLDEEKRIVVGPAMVPDLKIFRKDKNGDPYYVTFKEDTIKMIAEKYMRNKYIDNNDTEHNGKAADDVYVIESWIKEDEEDKSNKYGFEDLPIGTWFVSMKVRNDDVWNMVKEKKLNGFSVSGFFEEVEQFYKEQEFLRQLAEILKRV